MDYKKLLIITALGLLFLTSAFSISKLQNTKKELNEMTTLNKKLNEDNQKLLEANTKADQQIDELAKKYDALNKELTDVKQNTGY